MKRQDIPRIDGKLRKVSLRIPGAIYRCSGIVVFGRRIKSLVFTTDLAIIRNINADAILAVYPFSPQPVINQALLSAAEIPVFTGIGGGLTKGERVIRLASFAEMQGAAGVVVNVPTAPRLSTRSPQTSIFPSSSPLQGGRSALSIRSRRAFPLSMLPAQRHAADHSGGPQTLSRNPHHGKRRHHRRIDLRHD